MNAKWLKQNKPKFESESFDVDLSFSWWMRKNGHFMYVTNMEEYGHLVNPEDYSTEHLNNDMYEIFSNRKVCWSLSTPTGIMHTPFDAPTLTAHYRTGRPSTSILTGQNCLRKMLWPTWCVCVVCCGRHDACTLCAVVDMVRVCCVLWSTWCVCVVCCGRHGACVLCAVVDMVRVRCVLWPTWCVCVVCCGRHGVYVYCDRHGACVCCVP